MPLPVMMGTIDRRILVNYRVQPDVLAGLLPKPFRPHLWRGWGVAGICLIRLQALRPRRLPSLLGVSSENGAHRIAVEWDQSGATRRGVYIPRRDSSSWLNALAGGRLFPGEHHLARFEVNEREDRYEVAFQSCDDATRVAIVGTAADLWPRESIFASLEEASEFFAAGSLGYSDSRQPGRFEGLELNTLRWQVEPLQIERVESSFFHSERFPPGTVQVDHALLMRNIEHRWHSREPLCCGG